MGTSSQRTAETREYAPVSVPAQPDANAPATPDDPPPSFPYPIGQYANMRRPLARGASPAAGFRAIAITRLVFTLIEALICIRFVLKAIGANGTAAFSHLLYDITDVFVGPFVGVVPAPTVGQFTFELYDALAIGIYFLLGLLIVHLARIFLLDIFRV